MLVATINKVVQMQKELEQYLAKNGIVVPQTHHKSKYNRSGTCFQIKKPQSWLLPNKLFQTVTVRGVLVVEVLHDAPGVDDYLLQESLPLNVSLPSLQVCLTNMAEGASRQYIEDLASEWEDNIRENLEMLRPTERKSVDSKINQFHEDLKQLEHLISARDDINELIRLHDKIDSFDRELTEMRLSR